MSDAKVTQHMENPSDNEVLAFDSRTGKLMVQNRSEAERRRDTDRAIVDDMNKEGSGGFFSTTSENRSCTVWNDALVLEKQRLTAYITFA